jgi:nucleotide-binding universal stress UspA family protein
MFKHILLPTDGSELSLRAADMGIALAASLGARVFVFHVMKPFATVAYFADRLLSPEEAYNKKAAEHANSYLEDISRRARAANVPCEGSYEFDHRPYCAIIGVAAKHQCDLIIMGSYGRRGIDRLVPGGETHKVILNSNVPVLVCR